MHSSPLTLGELCDLIGEVLGDSLAPSYWVKAEINSLSVKGGHMYMELVEHSKTGLGAKMRATCWLGTQELLNAYFESETGQTLRPGMSVLVEAEVQWHAVYGLSLSIVGIDPSYTLGDMARERQRTIAQLQSDGLMDAQQLLPLPTLIRRIAVISSPSAAGYGDFLHQLETSHYRFETTLFGAVMQGDSAAQSILAALEEIAVLNEKMANDQIVNDQIVNGQMTKCFDCVVIIRGGGATSDLSCFDSYTLCAVCAQYELPVLTGIGHTRDVSVLDMVAHEALKTPTAVAEWLIHRMDAQSRRLDELSLRLHRAGERQVMLRLHRIEMLEQRLAACNPERFYRMGYALVMKDGRPVRSAAGLKQGDTLTACFADGSVQTVVQRTHGHR